jgi:hypothetical protein
LEWLRLAGPSPEKGSGYDELKSVVELSPFNAWAVGTGIDGALIEHWNGHAWATVPSHSSLNSGELHAVAAISPSDIWTAGMNENDEAYTEHWDGRRWSVVATPFPKDTISEINALKIPYIIQDTAAGKRLVDVYTPHSLTAVSSVYRVPPTILVCMELLLSGG